MKQYAHKGIEIFFQKYPKGYWFGKKRSAKDRKKMSMARMGRFAMENHPRWLGERVGYDALHDWVYKKLGAPMVCSGCEKACQNNYQIHWANVSGKYKRDTNDWARLCVKCHWQKDQATRKRKGNRWI